MQELLKNVQEIARAAGRAILQWHGQPGQLQIIKKQDQSPLTQADQAAHQIIIDGLNGLSPWPVLSEESAPYAWTERQQWQRYWLVDPLDGTRGFIRGSSEFTVNIALIKNHQPILGVVYAPVSQRVFYAAEGQAWQQMGTQAPQRLATQGLNWKSLRVVIGHYHDISKLERALSIYPGYVLQKTNSSLKFGLVAANEFDLYPRVGPTSEWDTAAGQCILEAAGGAVVDLSGKPLRYNVKESLRNPSFLAIGDPSQIATTLELVNSSLATGDLS